MLEVDSLLTTSLQHTNQWTPASATYSHLTFELEYLNLNLR